MADQEVPPGFVADGHAHIYPAFDLLRWFEAGVAAARRFACPLILFLTESTGCHYFAALREHSTAGPGKRQGTPLPGHIDGLLKRFRLSPTKEDCSLVVSEMEASAPPLYIVAGRQFVSREKLEVLALGLSPASPHAHRVDGDDSAQRLIELLLDEEVLVVLPWGFGKWTGRRRREVTRLASSPMLRSSPRFFIGDIAARSWPWRSPWSLAKGIRVLAGSDILPLQGAESSLACYGFRLPDPVDAARPFATVVASLGRSEPVELVGRRHGLPTALWHQVRYRLRAQG